MATTRLVKQGAAPHRLVGRVLEVRKKLQKCSNAPPHRFARRLVHQRGRDRGAVTEARRRQVDDSALPLSDQGVVFSVLVLLLPPLLLQGRGHLEPIF